MNTYVALGRRRVGKPARLRSQPMFNKMIAHFAGDEAKPSAKRKAADAGLNSSYVRHLRQVYRDVYGN